MLAELTLAVTSATTAAYGLRAHRLQRRLRTDTLTGLGNRAALEVAFNRARRGRRGEHLVAVALGDLNGFKAVNDAHGHRFGDQVLITVATALKSTAHRGELPVRLHGDEFAILLPATTAEQAEHRARQFQTAVAAIDQVHGQPVKVSMALGVMTAVASTANLTTLLASADHRMYGDKAAFPASARR
ncbi:hypothetical protein GCM10011581_43560 [Saccharopolyspora subtropica]|uniref:GGDEF domain-containing protein n=1 Tax=Saccharopolyspora thermophila TaxID=89367 RepID=A0A917NJ57_9PSEU|nr:GGDEF domain-containing protein [Saccharopolyspora subtropica]GGJ01678.1 hypothetical protein GCM10011581_43560 [Saccharopolyspora subtropica]